MSRIHITTIAPEAAAHKIMQHLEAHGGEWIVNSVEDEGYIMARVGTLDGKRLSRSLSPCLCGPFSTVTEIHMLTGELKVSRAVGYGLKSGMAGRSKTYGRAWISNGYEPRGDEATIVEFLRQSPLPVTELASCLGLPRKRVADLVRKLRERKCLELDHIEKACGARADHYVYKVAA